MLNVLEGKALPARRKLKRICILCSIVLKYPNMKAIKENVKENANRFKYTKIKHFGLPKK